MKTHAPTHHRAHKPLNQFCVHCGAKCGGPECRTCRSICEEISLAADDPYTGQIRDADGYVVEQDFVTGMIVESDEWPYDRESDPDF